MDRFVMRHPETAGVALVPASSLRLHRAHGWLRVSEPIPEESVDQVDVAEYAEAPDLDAAPIAAEPGPEIDLPAVAGTTVKTSKGQ